MIFGQERRDTRADGRARPYTLAVVASGVGITYLAWRITTLGSGLRLLLSVPLFAAELWSLVQLVLLGVQTRHGPPRRGIASDASSAPAGPLDVVVTAPGADLGAIERSLVGISTLPTNGTVVVVDDRERPDARALTRDLGGVYEVDPACSRDPATAALRHGTSELYLWLAAGQVPMPELPAITLPRFSDPRVSVCQVAVALLNADSLVHLRHGRDEQALIREVTGPSLDLMGLAPWWGAGAIVRRRAIADVGGFDPGDPAAVGRTLVNLHRAGWTTAFEAQPLIRAVAPDTLDEYLEERRTHAVASLGLLRTPQSPLGRSGGPLGVRAVHLAAVAAYGSGVRQLLVAAVLAATLVSGVMPFDAPAHHVAAAWALAASTALVARRALSRGTMGIGDWLRHGWRTLGADLSAVHAVATGRSHHRAGDADSGAPQGVRVIGRLRLLTATVVVLDLALLLRAATMVGPGLLPRFSTAERVLVLGAGIAALIPMVDVLQVLVRRRQRRRDFRRPVALEVELASTTATTVDISPTGIGVLMEFAPAIGTVTPVALRLPTDDGPMRTIRGTAMVRAANPDPGGLVRVGLELVNLNQQARSALIVLCAIGVPGHQIEPGTRAEIADPGHLLPDHPDLLRRSLRLLTVPAVLAGIITLTVGPGAADARATDTGRVDHVCVVTVTGDPVQGTVIELRRNDRWTPAGATNARGCVDVTDVREDTGIAAVHEGLRLVDEATATGDGRLTFQLDRSVVRVLDTAGSPVDGALVRYHTDHWREAGPTDAKGERGIDTLGSGANLEVTWNGGRLVRALEHDTTVVVLARLRTDPGVQADAVDRGAGWEPYTDGMELLPGRVAVRMHDGTVVKAEAVDGHELAVPSGTLTPTEGAP